MGVFNGISTWVEEIVKPRGFSSVDAGNLGALLLLGGIIGAVVMSALSDWVRRRVPFLAISLGVSAPALLWVTFADSRVGLAAAAFLLGFFMTSALPVGMQYSAEITAPVPEGTSNGMIQLAGQTSVVVVYLMAVTRTSSGSFVPSLCALAALLLICGVVVSRLPEPARHLARGSADVDPGAEDPEDMVANDTIPGLLSSAVERDAGGTWLRTDEGTLSFGGAAAHVGRIVERLTDAGVRRGDLVVVTARTTPPYVLVWLALATLGAVSVPTDPTGTSDELAGLLSQVRPPGRGHRRGSAPGRARQQCPQGRAGRSCSTSPTCSTTGAPSFRPPTCPWPTASTPAMWWCSSRPRGRPVGPSW